MGTSQQMEEEKSESNSLSILQARSTLYNQILWNMMKYVITKLGFGLILVSHTLKELGIVLDFWTKNNIR